MKKELLSNKLGFTQKEFAAIFIPLLQREGMVFQKSKNVFARPAVKGELIETITKDGKETQNTVKEENSFIVKNQTEAGEEYILTEEKFNQRYEWLTSSKNGYAEYKPKGKIIAVKLTTTLWNQLNFPSKHCFFEAPWGEPMVLKKFDYMVSPLDFSEVYRIARKEFWETYQKI